MRREQTEELCITVPPFFQCPISMDVMTSPVSLCTGVTYDRNSIQKWLSQGHNTCPATMQILNTTDITPNLTLRNLIHLWLSNVTSTEIISHHEALHIVQNLGSVEDKLASLNKLADFLRFSKENRELITASKDAVMEIFTLMRKCNDLRVCEGVIIVMDLISSVAGAPDILNAFILQTNHDILSRFVWVLRKGSLESRINVARICEFIAINSQSQRKVVEQEGLLNELFKLVEMETDKKVVDAGLSTVLAISTNRPAKTELVRFGIVRAASKILSEVEPVKENVTLIEKTMKVLEMVATCTEGRARIGEDEECVVEIMKKLMNCSRAATASGVTVVWSVCCLARNERVKERVNKVNGLTKFLVVMQSDCSANVRQMCVELVKALKVKNGKSCLACYDTRTTHITPY